MHAPLINTTQLKLPTHGTERHFAQSDDEMEKQPVASPPRPHDGQGEVEDEGNVRSRDVTPNTSVSRLSASEPYKGDKYEPTRYQVAGYREFKHNLDIREKRFCGLFRNLFRWRSSLWYDLVWDSQFALAPATRQLPPCRSLL